MPFLPGMEWPTVVTGGVLAMASFIVTLFHFFLEPFRWRASYLPAGAEPAMIARACDALFCTALATYLLPFKLGIPLRIALLRREACLSLHLISMVVALDGLITLCLWTVCTAFCVWVAALHWHLPWYAWLIGLVSVPVLFFAIVFHPRMHGRCVGRWHTVITLLDRPARRVAIVIAVVAVDILSYGVRHAILLWLVTGDVHMALTGGAIGIVATYAGIISGLPMGLVGYDASLIALLIAAGIGLDLALAVVLINRGLNLVSATILGVPAGVRLGLGVGALSILRKLWKLSHGKG